MKAPAPRLPNHRWPAWLLAAGVVFGLPATAFVYFPALLATNTLSPDSDSIGIPIFGSILLAAVLLPLAVGITYACLRRYASGASLLAWRGDAPLFSAAVTAFFGPPALGVVLLPFAMAADSRTPAIEFIWLPYAVCCAAWCVVLRAAALASPPSMAAVF